MYVLVNFTIFYLLIVNKIYFLGHSAGAQIGALAILQQALQNSGELHGKQNGLPSSLLFSPLLSSLYLVIFFSNCC
jgi:hypothetical protein